MASEAITISKQFSVSKSELYKAWTEKSSLKQWWKPSGKTLQSVTADIREGGHISYKFVDEKTEEGGLTIEGKYDTVVPEEKLVYSWNWALEDVAVENGNYKLTVEISGERDESEINVKQKNSSEEEGVHPHEEGWEDALNA